MLRELFIKNIALIDTLNVEFYSGLNILSGETGAGKSIIIDSLAFVLGGRADKTLIRYGETEAKVEAEFDTVTESAAKKLEEYEIDYSDGLIISRVMTTEGRNTCRINGIKLPLSVLKEVTSSLVDIYGQHENSVLLNTDSHMRILDNFSRDVLNKKAAYMKIFDEYKAINKAIKEIGELKEISKRMSELIEEIDEVEKAHITPGEEAELEEKLRFIEAAEEISDGLSDAYTALFDDERAIDSVSEAVKAIGKVKEYSEEYAAIAGRLEGVEIELEDILATISHLRAGVNFDSYEYERVNGRLNEIRELEMKYGGSEESVLSALKGMKAEYERISNAEFDSAELTRKKAETSKALSQAADELSAERIKAADIFDKAVYNELKELGMKNTAFKTQIVQPNKNALNENGRDSAEFLISPNPGQPLKPLSKIVSGGEMSRLMLAIKKITADIDGVNVMIFDEIDTGISGNVASVVAHKLYDIARLRQVLAITHLPQLASMADRHFLIEKTSGSNSTSTSLRNLNEDGMIREISRLAGGGDTEQGIAHAANMKSQANLYKTAERR